MRAELIRNRKNLPPPLLHTQYAHWLWADAREESVLPLPRDSVPITGAGAAGRDFSVNTLVSSSALTFYAPSFRVLYARSASLILVVSGMGKGTGGSLDPRVESRPASLAACGSGTHSGPNLPDPRGLTIHRRCLLGRRTVLSCHVKKIVGRRQKSRFSSKMFSLPTVNGPSLFWIARPFWRLGNAAYAGSGHVACHGW